MNDEYTRTHALANIFSADYPVSSIWTTCAVIPQSNKIKDPQLISVGTTKDLLFMELLNSFNT